MSFSFTTIRFIAAVLCIGVFLYGYSVLRAVPAQFPAGKNFIVDEDENVSSISKRLENEHYITSAAWFRAWVSFLGKDRHIQLGGYIFDRPVSLGSVIGKLVSGHPDVPLISVTIPEGTPTHDVAVLFQKALPTISVSLFEQKVRTKDVDGKLFPSTYFLLPSTTEDRAIEIMTGTFEKKYTDSFADIRIPAPLTKQEEIISLAAILEDEAKTPEDMRIIAGILLKRLQNNMALQVDAAPETYKSRGLPKVPINNPGLISLSAALHPESSPYLYYLTGKDGTMHYAKTFTEHKSNIQKYLR